MKPIPCPVPVCGKKEPPADGCSHVDCPHRRPLTAAPKRTGDGMIPPRSSPSKVATSGNHAVQSFRFFVRSSTD
jgi:hypothetical protein